MIDITNRAVWLYREPVDFRKQVNGLVQLILDEKGRHANDGAIYVFRNQHRNRLKLIFWHKNGFFLHSVVTRCLATEKCIGYEQLLKKRLYFLHTELRCLANA